MAAGKASGRRKPRKWCGFRKISGKSTVDTHQEILSGVLDQDPQAARAAMALHLEMNRIVIKHAKERSEKTK